MSITWFCPVFVSKIGNFHSSTLNFPPWIPDIKKSHLIAIFLYFKYIIISFHFVFLQDKILANRLYLQLLLLYFFSRKLFGKPNNWLTTALMSTLYNYAGYTHSCHPSPVLGNWPLSSGRCSPWSSRYTPAQRGKVVGSLERSVSHPLPCVSTDHIENWSWKAATL